MQVHQMEITNEMYVSDLINQLSGAGVVGAGNVANASNLLIKMVNNPDMKVFMSVAGPMVPCGLRNIISDMIKNSYIDVLFTSGANITHDILEAFGGRHYKDMGFNDDELQEKGLGRIGNAYTKSSDFEVFEEEIIKIFTKISKKTNKISIKDLLYEIGGEITDENSILKVAHDYNVPIFAPGLIDCMLGLQLWIFNQENDLAVDAVADMPDLSDIVYESKEIGGIILGGGVPKHYLLASNLLKGGLDSAFQITMDREETGSLSGAKLEEAVSWSKAKKGSNLITIVGDATVLFPLILAGSIDKFNK